MQRAGDSLIKLINESLAIEAEEAKEAGTLGFMARALVQATMPHRDPKEWFFERTNGAFTLTMMAPPKVGLPYGSVPRLLLAWITTEAVRTRSRDLALGDSLSGFMRELGMVPTGGRWGSITRLREQSRRLFTTAISCLYEGENRGGEIGFRLVDKHVLWWNPKSPDQRELFASTLTLSEPFFKEVISHPVPIDLRALKALSRSPLALDIYTWLTYRMSYLQRETTVPWAALEVQFGAGYKRTRDFKAAFVEHLKSVLAVYREAKASGTDRGLFLRPSPPHVRRLVPGI
ncbi:MAG: replication protein RepA [Acidobacteria bacterium]|nr:replication protein RepA [Acidobacteriota bacterium]